LYGGRHGPPSGGASHLLGAGVACAAGLWAWLSRSAEFFFGISVRLAGAKPPIGIGRLISVVAALVK
jgi:hypothetical protein